VKIYAELGMKTSRNARKLLELEDKKPLG